MDRFLRGVRSDCVRYVGIGFLVFAFCQFLLFAEERQGGEVSPEEHNFPVLQLSADEVHGIFNTRESYIYLNDAAKAAFRAISSLPCLECCSGGLQRCCQRVIEGYNTVSYEDVLCVAKEI